MCFACHGGAGSGRCGRDGAGVATVGERAEGHGAFCRGMVWRAFARFELCLGAEWSWREALLGEEEEEEERGCFGIGGRSGFGLLGGHRGVGLKGRWISFFEIERTAVSGRGSLEQNQTRHEDLM